MISVAAMRWFLLFIVMLVNLEKCHATGCVNLALKWDPKIISSHPFISWSMNCLQLQWTREKWSLFTQHLDCPSVQTVKIYAVKYVTNKMPLSCQSIENEFMVVVSSFSCKYFCKNWHPLLGWALRTQSLIYMFNSIRADAHCLVNPTYLSLSINDGKNKIDWLRDKPISLFWSTADDVTNNEEDDDEEEVIEKWEESGKIKMSTLVQCWLYILVI